MFIFIIMTKVIIAVFTVGKSQGLILFAEQNVASSIIIDDRRTFGALLRWY